MEVYEPQMRHALMQYRCCQICLQAKVKEPELYELHDRVTQIRTNLNGTADGKDLAIQHDMAQNGVATQ